MNSNYRDDLLDDIYPSDRAFTSPDDQPSAVIPVTDEQVRIFDHLVDILSLKERLPIASTTEGVDKVIKDQSRNYFTLTDFHTTEVKIKYLRSLLSPSQAQIRLAFVLCRRAGMRNSMSHLKTMSRMQVERAIAEANNLLSSPVAQDQRKNSLVEQRLKQHEAFRARFNPVQPYSVSDTQWNSWLSQKPDSIVGWDEWVSRKPLGVVSYPVE